MTDQQLFDVPRPAFKPGPGPRSSSEADAYSRHRDELRLAGFRDAEAEWERRHSANLEDEITLDAIAHLGTPRPALPQYGKTRKVAALRRLRITLPKEWRALVHECKRARVEGCGCPLCLQCRIRPYKPAVGA